MIVLVVLFFTGLAGLLVVVMGEKFQKIFIAIFRYSSFAFSKSKIFVKFYADTANMSIDNPVVHGVFSP